MPATSTNTAPKPKTKTSAKSKAKTRVEPDTQTEVRPTVQTAVNAYVKADAAMQSKLWPLVEEALDLLDEPMEPKHIIDQFRQAFILAHNIQPGKYRDNAEYARFRQATLNIIRVVSLGRVTVETNRKKGAGFWNLLELSNEKAKADGNMDHFESDVSGKKPNPETPPPTPAKNAKRNGSKAEEEDEEEAEPEAKSGSVKVPKWTPAWSEAFRHIVQHEPEGLIEDLEFCCARGWLPTDEDWLALAKHVLMGEQEN